MSELGKPFLKNQIQKIKKKQKINVKMPHVNKKPLAKNKKLWFKQNTRPRINY